MDQDRIRARLQKLLALAKRGEGGEKENAQRFLETLLKKHGLTLDDLDDEAAPKIEAEFKYRDALERKLLFQVISMVLDSANVRYRQVVGGRAIRIDITRAQAAEVSTFYEAYKPAMRKTMERAFLAFVQTNRIFGTASNEDADDRPRMSKEELDALIAMMRGMRPTPVHRAIGHDKRGG